MRHALSGIASCALALALTVSTADAGSSDAKFRATRDITVDSATGKPRKPTAAEVETLIADLRRLTSQKSVSVASAVPGPTGGRTLALEGNDGVVLARARADGTYETRCVFTFEEGVEFLGLVADETE